MENFFKNCLSIEAIKKHFKALVLKYHPDLKGGDLEIMKLINIQYQEALKTCDGKTYKGDDEKEHTYTYSSEIEEELMNKITELVSLQMSNVEIHLIGLWLWIMGETKIYKDQLKVLGCFWHSKRECWYFKSQQIKSRSSKGSLEDIAKKYGVTNINNLKNKKFIKNS